MLSSHLLSCIVQTRTRCIHSISLQFVFNFIYFVSSFPIRLSHLCQSPGWCDGCSLVAGHARAPFAWVISIIGRQSIFIVTKNVEACTQPHIHSQRPKWKRKRAMIRWTYFAGNHLAGFCYTLQIIFVDQTNLNVCITLRHAQTHADNGTFVQCADDVDVSDANDDEDAQLMLPRVAFFLYYKLSFDMQTFN